MDLVIAHTRLAQTFAPARTSEWVHLVERDRVLVDALAEGLQPGLRRLLMVRLAEQHQAMWQTLQSVHR